MATIVLGADPEHIRLLGVIENHSFVARVEYNGGAEWPAEPRLVFSNGDVWLPVADGNYRVWNIPAASVNRVIDLELHSVEFYIGSTLHSRSLDGY